jgi:hypothetical protein
MRTQAVLAVILFFLNTANVAAQNSTATEYYGVDEAYRVYNVLLPHEESVGFAKGTLVIREETVSKPEAPEPCLTAEAANKFKDAIADYKHVNSKPWLLQRQFQLEKPYEIVSTNTIEILFKKDGWNAFYRRYPDSGGYIILSAVGFNQEQTQAIVYTGSSCGGLCGRWSLHLMEKIGGKWTQAPGVSCITVS